MDGKLGVADASMPQSGRFPAAGSGAFSRAVSAHTQSRLQGDAFRNRFWRHPPPGRGRRWSGQQKRQAMGNSATSLASEALANRAKIRRRATGAAFTIIAENNSPENCYIQSAKLNGGELTRSWFTHGDIVAGGELYFRMGNKPNKDWASAKEDRPPSGLIQ